VNARLLLLLSALTLALPSAASSRPKSIILIIGDGMGSAQVTGARFLRGAEFNIGRMPVTGWVATRSANSVVTDSAAAATAYATGERTNNRMVAVRPDGTPLTTALEIAEKSGRATGLVTTADFFDATPASFAAHHKSRYDSEPIVRQMLKSGAEILAGGGAEKFGTAKIPVTVEALAAENGFTLVRSAKDLATANGAHILAVFPTQPDEIDSPEAPLPMLAQWALERLSKNRRGFFLLLENEGTDGSAHHNVTADYERAIQSIDQTVGVALDFAKTHRDVLVIVTGDHETGGLRIEKENSPNLAFVWSSTGHTGESVPIFASGPGAESFMGLLDNFEVGRRILRLLLAR
jgi:alkaline phosphatase